MLNAGAFISVNELFGLTGELSEDWFIYRNFNIFGLVRNYEGSQGSQLSLNLLFTKVIVFLEVQEV